MGENAIAIKIRLAKTTATRFTVYLSVFPNSRPFKIALAGLLPFAAEMNGPGSAKMLIGKYS